MDGDLWIGGKQIYNSGTALSTISVTGMTGTWAVSDNTVTYTEGSVEKIRITYAPGSGTYGTFTITLNSATITASSGAGTYKSAISAPEGSVLVIPFGENMLTASSGGYGIYAHTLTVDGYGKLTVDAKKNGLYAHSKMIIKNATVISNAEQNVIYVHTGSAYGLTITNATVTAETTSDSLPAISASQNDAPITITGGSTVTATSGYQAFNKAPVLDPGVEVKAGDTEGGAQYVEPSSDSTYYQKKYVKITPPSDSAELSSITLTYNKQGSTETQTDTIYVTSGITAYSHPVWYGAETVDITAHKQSSSATVTGDGTDKPLSFGKNTFSITVTNGVNTNTYTLEITRANPVTVTPAEDVTVPAWKIGTANPSPGTVAVSSPYSTPLYIRASLSGPNSGYFSIGASLTHTQEMKGIKVDSTTFPTFYIYPYEKEITAASDYTAALTLKFYTDEACTTPAGIPEVTRNVKLTVKPADSVTSTYTIRYEAGNTHHATGNVDSVTADVGTSHTVKANGFTNLNKVFVNWNTKADGSGTAYTPGETFSPSAGEMTLYAQWMDPQATAYTVKYNHGTTDFATGTMPDVSVIIGNTHTVKENGFGNSAEVFVNWNTKEDGTGTPYAPGDTFTPTKDVTLYAQWIAEGATAYTVTYNHGTGNYITGTMNPIVVPVGTSHTVKANEFKNSEKVFDKWNTKEDGSGTSYNPGESISEGMTLYAQWKDPEATYTVKYNHGNTLHATGTMSEDVLHPGETHVVKANGFGNPVDVFLNWNTAADGSGTSYNPGDVLTPAGDVTLYAQWRYAVTPQGHSGSGSSDGRYFEYPRTVKDGGSVSFGKSPVVVEVILPKGSTGEVVLTVESVEDWPAKEKTPYAFDISAPGKAEGIAQIIFKIKLADLERLEVLPKDVGIFHKVGDEWVQLKTVYEIKDTHVYYTADTDAFSPFEIRFVEDGAVPKDSAEPVVPDTPVTPETPDEPDTPVEPETPETPAPLLGVLAGLGAALIIRRK